MKEPASYSKLLMRLLYAARRLHPTKAVLIGLWWERWAANNKSRWHQEGIIK